MAAERSKRFFGEGCLRVSSRTKSKGLRWKDHFVHGKRTGQRLRGFVCFHLGCTWGGRREALSRAWAFFYYGELGARGGVWMRRERRSRTACNHSVGSKKKVRCVQQEGRSPGGSSGRSGGAWLERASGGAHPVGRRGGARANWPCGVKRTRALHSGAALTDALSSSKPRSSCTRTYWTGSR